MKIGIIMGSIREGRANEAVSNWVKEVAENYTCIKKYAARP